MKRTLIAISLLVLSLASCSSESEWDKPIPRGNQQGQIQIEEPGSPLSPPPAEPSAQTPTSTPDSVPLPDVTPTPKPSTSPSPTPAPKPSVSPSPTPAPKPSVSPSPTPPESPTQVLTGFESAEELFDFFYNRGLDLTGRTLTYEEISQDILVNEKDVTANWDSASTEKKHELIKKYVTGSPFEEYTHYEEGMSSPEKVKANILLWYSLSYLWESIPLNADLSNAIVEVSKTKYYVNNSGIVFLSDVGEVIEDTVEESLLPKVHAVKTDQGWLLDMLSVIESG